MHTVKFIKAFKPAKFNKNHSQESYEIGDEVEFSAVVATSLIAVGVAEEVKPVTTSKAKKPKKEV